MRRRFRLKFSQIITFFKKRGNEQQFNFSKILKTSIAAVKALEGRNIAKVKEELAQGISLLVDRQKIIKLADKSEFGWAAMQEHLGDDLADSEADALKIRDRSLFMGG